MNILVTGGAGFIGSNFIRYWLRNYPKDKIMIADSLTYAGNRGSLQDFINRKNISFVRSNIQDKGKMLEVTKRIDILFHFAAETHVDRSILDGAIFLKTNAIGTQTLLDCALKSKIKKFISISTDEVYGSIASGSFTEKSPVEPNSPYAASKAAADLMVQAYWKTYRLPVIITRCSNNFGPYQFPEKVIPLFITNLLDGKKIPIYGTGMNIREWIYVMDHASALDVISKKGKLGEVYNIGSGVEMTNIELAQSILRIMEKTDDPIEFVKDRLGHDLRYSLDSSKLRALGWRPQYDFKDALEETIDWYRRNRGWWQKTKQKKNFKNYLKKNYQ